MIRNWRRFAGALLLIAVAGSNAQTPPQFDAATIKLTQRGDPGDGTMKGGPGTSSPGRVTWQPVWLGTLLATAFRVDRLHVSGSPWIMQMAHNYMCSRP
jgi:uncharacterized protein (TIGR03435 family)